MKKSLLALLLGTMAAIAPTTTLKAQEIFGEQSVDQDSFIAIASPGSNFYSLVILEQQSEERPCWAESGTAPAVIEPLLLDFDFSGICGRGTDSNGYSIRIDGRDRYADYLLKVIPGETEIQLVATPRKRDIPSQMGNSNDDAELVIGRTSGIAPGFLRIDLEPGWQFTKRTYEGKPLGHVYLSHGGNNVVSSF